MVEVPITPKPESGFSALLSLCTDGTSLAATTRKGQVYITSTNKLDRIREVAPAKPQPGRPLEGAHATGLCFIGKGRLLVPRTFSYKDGYGAALQVVDTDSGEVVRQHEVALQHVSHCLVDPTGRLLVVLSTQGPKIWQLRDILGT